MYIYTYISYRYIHTCVIYIYTYTFVFGFGNPFPLILNTPLETMMDVGNFYIIGTIHGAFNIRVMGLLCGCEILHQFIGGKNPITSRLSTIPGGDFCHPQYHSPSQN